ISEDEGAEKGSGYNPKRGERVIAWARNFLDQSVPLDGARWSDVTGLSVEGGKLVVRTEGGAVALNDGAQFAGYNGDAGAPSEIVLRKNNLHVRVIVKADHPIGRDDKAHIADVVVESAITTIMDCEDSVAAVDAEDKV